MRHIDLFSGIGGFALAVDTVWPNSEHIFCDNDPFCQQVLKKQIPLQAVVQDGMKTGLKLHSDFVSWMMGYPINWLDLD